MKMEKEILDRGYITHMLTNEKKEIYGLSKAHYIEWEINEIEKSHQFFWSEVYVEPDYMAVIIRTGTRLVDPTSEELKQYFEQSKINFAK